MVITVCASFSASSEEDVAHVKVVQVPGDDSAQQGGNPKPKVKRPSRLGETDASCAAQISSDSVCALEYPISTQVAEYGKGTSCQQLDWCWYTCNC